MAATFETVRWAWQNANRGSTVIEALADQSVVVELRDRSLAQVPYTVLALGPKTSSVTFGEPVPVTREVVAAAAKMSAGDLTRPLPRVAPKPRTSAPRASAPRAPQASAAAATGRVVASAQRSESEGQVVTGLLDAELLDTGRLSANAMARARTAPDLAGGVDPVAEALRVAGLVNAAAADGRISQGKRLEWAHKLAAKPELEPWFAAMERGLASAGTGAAAASEPDPFELDRARRFRDGPAAARAVEQHPSSPASPAGAFEARRRYKTGSTSTREMRAELKTIDDGGK